MNRRPAGPQAELEVGADPPVRQRPPVPTLFRAPRKAEKYLWAGQGVPLMTSRLGTAWFPVVAGRSQGLEPEPLQGGRAGPAAKTGRGLVVGHV